MPCRTDGICPDADGDQGDDHRTLNGTRCRAAPGHPLKFQVSPGGADRVWPTECRARHLGLRAPASPGTRHGGKRCSGRTAWLFICRASRTSGYSDASPSLPTARSTSASGTPSSAHSRGLRAPRDRRWSGSRGCEHEQDAPRPLARKLAKIRQDRGRWPSGACDGVRRPRLRIALPRDPDQLRTT